MTTIDVKVPALDDLPTEIVEMMIGHTDHDTMCSLRLSNKWVSKVSKRPFAEAYMAERRHVVSRESLEVLAEIAAHKDFGPAVRKILLGSSRLTSTGVDELTAVISDLDMHHTEIDSWVFCDDLVQEQDDLDTTTEGVLLIKEALRHISARGQTVVLGTWVNIIHISERSFFPASPVAPWYTLNAGYLYSGFGYKELYSGLFPDDFDDDLDVDQEFTRSSSATLNIVLQAIGGDDCPVDGLQLEFSGTEDKIERLSSRFSQALASRVRSLSIRVGLESDSGSGCISNIRSLLEHTSNLESFSITVDPRRQNASRTFAKTMTGRMLGSITTKKLRTLHLASITTKSAHLVELLKEHTDTLRDLALRFVEIDSDSSDEVFEWMSPNLSLDSFAVEGPLIILQHPGRKWFPLYREAQVYHGLAVSGGMQEMYSRAVEARGWRGETSMIGPGKAGSNSERRSLVQLVSPYKQCFFRLIEVLRRCQLRFVRLSSMSQCAKAMFVEDTSLP